MYLRYRGLTFGGNSGALIITDFKAPTLEIQNDYSNKTSLDGVMVTQDALTKASWQFSLATNGRNLDDALSVASDLQGRWQDKVIRSSAFPTILQYSHDNVRWYRIYGRPGRFTSIEPNVYAKLGVGRIEMEFIQTNPYTYSSEDRSITINAVPAIQGGITAPIVTPITTSGSGGERAGRVINNGNVNAPMILKFYGPSTNPTIRGDNGFVLTYKGTLAYDQTVTIDPVQHEVRLNTANNYPGVQVPGRLSRRTRLAGLTTPPGTSEWFYTALDDTGTSRAELITRDAYNSFK